jgi:DNA mismatch repair protein MutL
MNKIFVLPSAISQKIAAGEVIERPVSVVKELVENSLDAGASEISIELVQAGKKVIRVRDDGCGMSREDAETAFVRHSTSKIVREEDLLAISSLGFRGEALPSISSVSRLTLRTSEGGEVSGTEIEREGDRSVAVRDVAHPRGTTIEVRELFFNLPARRKFLRTDTSELQTIVKYVTNVALAYPGLRLALSHESRSILSCPAVGNLRERLFQLFGKSLLDRLMEVDLTEEGGRISGYSSLPPSGKAGRPHQSFFVNKRPVRDRILSSALNQAYKGILEKDLSAEAFLFLTIPFEDVDVNVHPAKAEVRFRHSPSVFRLVLRGVEQARKRAGGIKTVQPPAWVIPPAGERPEVGDLQIPYGLPRERQPFFPAAQPPGHETEPRADGSGLRVLGQLAGSYILAVDEEGILVVDQHNAHERVLFEKYREIESRKAWPVTMSLIPLVFELSPSQTLSLEKNEGLLRESGFRVEPMAGRSYALREYPDIFKPEEALAAFLGILEEIENGEAERKKDRLLATLACKTAIKAGEPLIGEKMKFLLEELFKTSNPSLCPHGRPIMVRISLSHIEKSLGRSPR